MAIPGGPGLLQAVAAIWRQLGGVELHAQRGMPARRGLASKTGWGPSYPTGTTSELEETGTMNTTTHRGVLTLGLAALAFAAPIAAQFPRDRALVVAAGTQPE